MRRAFARVIEEMMSIDSSIFVLLGDIGVGGFQNAGTVFPNRILNAGIAEQSMVGIAGGLALSGYKPILHSIAPFIIERALEQIKIDFGYQNLSGVFVTVGSSYDYSKLGSTHHSPGDIQIALTIPRMHTYIPGNARELELIIKKSIVCNELAYIRMSEMQNLYELPNHVGLQKLKDGSAMTVLAIGPSLDSAYEAVKGRDIELYYTNVLSPFEYSELVAKSADKKLLVVEPFYECTSSLIFNANFLENYSKIRFVGVKRVFIREYGNLEQIHEKYGPNTSRISEVIDEMLAI